jgi:hypothetical protein
MTSDERCCAVTGQADAERGRGAEHGTLRMGDAF